MSSPGIGHRPALPNTSRWPAGAASDDGPWSIFVNWGDGPTESFAASTTGALSRTHSYADTGIYAVTVVARDRNAVRAVPIQFTATMANAAPTITSITLKDPTGATLGDTVRALSALPVDLSASFADVGILDTHAATINWGDGTNSAGLVVESGGAGTLTAGHSWKVPGTYAVTVVVDDDDRGRGSRDLSVTVVDGATAVCATAQPIGALLSTLQPGSTKANTVALLLGIIAGNDGGVAENGACDQFRRGRYTAGVRTLVRAVGVVEALIGGGGLTPSQVGELKGVEARLVLSAKWTYGMLVSRATDRLKLKAAAALARLAEAATAAKHPLVAIGCWWQAVSTLAPEQ